MIKPLQGHFIKVQLNVKVMQYITMEIAATDGWNWIEQISNEDLMELWGFIERDMKRIFLF